MYKIIFAKVGQKADDVSVHVMYANALGMFLDILCLESVYYTYEKTVSDRSWANFLAVLSSLSL